MSYEDISAINDPLEAIRALFNEMKDVKSELSSTKSEVSRINRNNTKLHVDNKKLKVENEKLKAENEQLKRQVEKLGGTYVEKNSTNSSLPPTKQRIKDEVIQRTQSLRTPSGKKPGGQKGHEGHTLQKEESPNITIEHKARICPHCGCAIPEDAAQVCVKSTQVIDITGVLLPPSVVQHDVYSAVCPHCHKKVRGENPTDKCKNTVYGPNLQTMVVYLSIVQFVPYERICEIVRDIFLVSSFSEGSLSNILERNTEKATPIYASILAYIERMKAAGMDETGMYINKQLCWFWCLQCPKFCYVFADKSRGMAALENHGIPKHLEGLILYTDRHGTYFKLKCAGHQVCLVHLERNLNYLSDLNKNQDWSVRVKELLKEAMHLKNTVPLGNIDKDGFCKRLHELLEEDLSKYERKDRGDFQALQNGLINCEDYIFTFLEHDEVPHHNNSSEGAIRVLKVKAKVSGCFRTERGAEQFAVFHSITETARRNDISKFKALYRLISDMAPKSTFIEDLISKEG